MANIPNKSDGQVLNASELFKIIGTDLSQGITTSTSETEIGEVIVSANQASQGIIIIASVSFENTEGTGRDATIRLRTGTSSTASSNTLRQELPLSIQAGTNQLEVGGTILYMITSSDETFTSDFNVHITGFTSGGSTAIVKCNSIMVFGV